MIWTMSDQNMLTCEIYIQKILRLKYLYIDIDVI